MKVLELYSGIGGMHLALQESKITGEVVASIDINNVANIVYKHNFPGTKLLNNNVQSLTSKYVNDLGVDTILMSPPCQPFTRNGKKLDVSDARTCSFLHLLNILPDLDIKYILIENVKGFETSVMHEKLLKTLESCNFQFQEFILSPTQFGIPNTRHRYYCLAKKLPLTFSFNAGPLLEDLPNSKLNDTPLFEISTILENDINIQNFKLSNQLLQKHGNVLDICYSNSKRSCCFTKAYGRYVQGTGSVYCEKSREELNLAFSMDNEEERLKYLKLLNLRFFTPNEVAKLMSFPNNFEFPQSISDKQKYMLLGNSINIKVVSELLKILYE